MPYQELSAKRQYTLNLPPLPWARLLRPQSLQSLFKKMERNVIRLAAGTPEFFDHSQRAFSIEAVHHNHRRALQVRPRCEKRSYRIASSLVVRRVRTVVLGH